MPIRALNRYLNRWTIRGRVTNKAELRQWSNARGTGKVWSFDVVDDQGGEIRCTAFNEAAEHWSTVVEIGKVYAVGMGQLKPKRRVSGARERVLCGTSFAWGWGQLSASVSGW